MLNLQTFSVYLNYFYTIVRTIVLQSFAIPVDFLYNSSECSFLRGLCVSLVRVRRVINDSFNLHRFILTLFPPFASASSLSSSCSVAFYFRCVCTWQQQQQQLQHGTKNRTTSTTPTSLRPMQKRIQRTAPKLHIFFLLFPFLFGLFFFFFFGYILFHAISLILLQQLRNFHLLLFSFLGSVIECNCRTESRANVTYHYPRAAL